MRTCHTVREPFVFVYYNWRTDLQPTPASARILEGRTRRHGAANQAQGHDALEVLQAEVVGQCYKRHRHQEFLKFLRRLDEEFPSPTPLHLAIDNYGTHKHARV